MTANAALYDAADGRICLPGLSEEQIPLGDTELVGISQDTGGSFYRYNDLNAFGAYVRAGALGPDAFPDMIYGQLATHVDHSRTRADDEMYDVFGIGGLLPDCDDEPLTSDEQKNCSTLKQVNWLFGEHFAPMLLAPLQHIYPRWRSIDWGHEVMRSAQRFHLGRLGQITRDEALSDPWLARYYQERQSALAFAHGYLMHFAGDGFAHGWINEWTGQPFNLFTSRKHDDPITTPKANLNELTAYEEMLHTALEGYVDSRYVPQIVGDGCDPEDATTRSTTTNLCQQTPTTELPPDCDYCNPMRGTAFPPDAPLSTVCTDCFDGCNPWTEICAPRTYEGLPCGQCSDRQTRISNCMAQTGGTMQECTRIIDLECANEAQEQCCIPLVDTLVRTGLIREDQRQEFTCEGSLVQPSDIYDAVLAARDKMWSKMTPDTQAQIAPHAPNGCYLGQFSDMGFTAEDLTVFFPELANLPADARLGTATDFNHDGDTDLLNECMLWNCMLSPGSSICPLNALRVTLPASLNDDGLVCQDITQVDLDLQPEVLLNDTLIAVPRAFYRYTWLDRRFSEDPKAVHNGFGSWSIGGFIPAIAHTTEDMLYVGTTALSALRDPLGLLVEHCMADERHYSDALCDMVESVAIIKGIIVAAVATVNGLAVAVSHIPFIGQAVAIPLFYTVAMLDLALWHFDHSLVPALVEPLEAIRAEVRNHLRVRWTDMVAVTAQEMSGYECTPTCGGPPNPNCTRHRLFALQNTIIWLEELYNILANVYDSERCYLGSASTMRMEEIQNASVADWVVWAFTGELAWIPSVMACNAVTEIWQNTFGPSMADMIQDTVGVNLVDELCAVADAYRTQFSSTGAPSLGGAPSGFEECMSDGGANPPDPEAVSQAWRETCAERIQLYFGSQDPNDWVVALREMVIALDSGEFTDEQKQVLYRPIECSVEAMTGVEVDLAQIEAYLDSFNDCFSLPGLDLESPDIREYLISLLPDEGERIVRAIDEQIGAFEEFVAGCVEDVDPIPVADIEEFAPMYNTVVLNKIGLMGSGEMSCLRFQRRCEQLQDPMACAMSERCEGQGDPNILPLPGESKGSQSTQIKSWKTMQVELAGEWSFKTYQTIWNQGSGSDGEGSGDDEKDPAKDGSESDPPAGDGDGNKEPTTSGDTQVVKPTWPTVGAWTGPLPHDAGLYGVVRAANRVELPTSAQGATSAGYLNEHPLGYLAELFDQRFVDEAASDFVTCSGMDFHIMCQSIASLDDPDDYCHELADWNLGFYYDGVAEKLERACNAFCTIAPRTAHFGQSKEECVPLCLASGFDIPEWFSHECGLDLKGIDAWAAAQTPAITPYAPTHRREQAPLDHVQELYDSPVPSEFHRDMPNFASVQAHRVVAQGVWADSLPEPHAEHSAAYFPERLTRFALSSDYNRLSRAYAHTFAPYYCPKAGPAQADADCDSVPDACDNCPQVYNPDQRDKVSFGPEGDEIQLPDGIGDDCQYSYNPCTKVTVPSAQRLACEVVDFDPPGNLLDDSGFEENIWGPIPFWPWHMHTGGGYVVVEDDASTHHAGWRSAKVLASSPAFTAVGQHISTVPGAKYSARALVFMPPGEEGGRLRVKSGTKVLAEAQIVGQGGYVPVVVSFVADAQTTEIAVGLQGVTSSQWLRVDDVSAIRRGIGNIYEPLFSLNEQYEFGGTFTPSHSLQ